jgi:hypothetical protein
LQLLLAVGILLPALYGFGTKFRELTLLYGGYERTRAAARPHLTPEQRAELQDIQERQGLTDEATEGAFALVPILNYLLVTLGFLFLFVWWVMSGAFRDLERPKYNMLENETILDALALQAGPRSPPNSCSRPG